MAIALFSFSSPRDDGGGVTVAPPAAGRPRLSAFQRVTPDDLPYATTFGTRGLLLVDLTAPSAPQSGPPVAEGYRASVFRGRFTRIGHFSAGADDPDPHRAAGLLVVLVNNTIRDRERQFNEWYDGSHLAEITDAGGFSGAARYRNEAETVEEGSARYLAVYVTDDPDVAARHAAVREAVPRMTLWPGVEQVHGGAYRRIAP